MEFVNSPTWWTVTLWDGGVVRVMADSVRDSGESWCFDALVDASEDEQAVVRVVARSSSEPRRVTIRLAEVPSESVSGWEGGVPLS